MLVAQTSPHVSFALASIGKVYGHTLVVLAMAGLSSLASLQSRIHEVWTRRFAASMKDDQRYLPADCFRTFPFPEGFETNPALEAAGEAYHAFRAQLMIARNEGLTKTYNRFHARAEAAADIAELRRLHAAMDDAVLRAYGWDDLADCAAPTFIEQEADEGKTPKTRLDWPAEFKDEVLARLLALNAERHAEEVRLGIRAGAETNDEVEDEEDEA